MIPTMTLQLLSILIELSIQTRYIIHKSVFLWNFTSFDNHRAHVVNLHSNLCFNFLPDCAAMSVDITKMARWCRFLLDDNAAKLNYLHIYTLVVLILIYNPPTDQCASWCPCDSGTPTLTTWNTRLDPCQSSGSYWTHPFQLYWTEHLKYWGSTICWTDLSYVDTYRSHVSYSTWGTSTFWLFKMVEIC